MYLYKQWVTHLQKIQLSLKPISKYIMNIGKLQQQALFTNKPYLHIFRLLLCIQI